MLPNISQVFENHESSCRMSMFAESDNMGKMEKTFPNRENVGMNKRQIILETALALFQAEGYQAVGIDRVIATSGVAKMTMYKHFPSKTALIEAVLAERDARFRHSLSHFTAQFSGPLAQLHALFLWHQRWFQDRSFRGCMFINATAEFSECHHPVRQAARQHKMWLRAFIGALLEQRLTAEASRRLALQCAYLLDGATVAAQLMDAPDAESSPALHAWRAMASLLRQEGLDVSSFMTLPDTGPGVSSW
jgi:AcrR family transcriptional regulator